MAIILIKSKLQHLAIQKKDAYVTRSVNLPMIGEKTLIERAAENSLINEGHLYAAMAAITQAFRNFLFMGHPVQLPKVGIFRFAIKAKASENMEEAGVEQIYRRRINYLPTTELRKALNEIHLEKLQQDIVDDTNADNKESQDGDNNGGDGNNG